jgi:hypothetical protein
VAIAQGSPFLEPVSIRYTKLLAVSNPRTGRIFMSIQAFGFIENIHTLGRLVSIQNNKVPTPQK